MCGIAFGKRKLCARILDIGCLYAVSFAFSGITYAVWLFVAPNGLFWRNGYAYFAVSPLQFVLLVTAAYGILSLIRFIIHTVRVQSGQTVRITLQANAHTVQGVALVDSGNLLKEPISGEAVVVADRDFALPVLPLLANLTAESATDNESALTDLQFRFVQFHTIAGGGLMPAGRVAAIRSPDVRLLPAAQLYVAVCVDLRKNTGYDALVPESAFRHDFCRSSLNKKERVHSG